VNELVNSTPLKLFMLPMSWGSLRGLSLQVLCQHLGWLLVGNTQLLLLPSPARPFLHHIPPASYVMMPKAKPSLHHLCRPALLLMDHRMDEGVPHAIEMCGRSFLQDRSNYSDALDPPMPIFSRSIPRSGAFVRGLHRGQSMHWYL
jgi:hypothetical protein